MASEALARAARAAAAAALRPEDAKGRQALCRLVSLWEEARAPFVIDGRGPFAAALVIPSPAAFHSGRFHGPVRGLAFVPDAPEPVRPFRIANAELGPGLPHAAAREAGVPPTSFHRSLREREGDPKGLSPAPERLPGWAVLASEVAGLLRDRLGDGQVTLRLPFDCQDGEASAEWGLRFSTCYGRDTRSFNERAVLRLGSAARAGTPPAGRLRAGAALARLPAADVDWAGYAAALLHGAGQEARREEARLAALAAAAFAARLDRFVVEGMRPARSDALGLYAWLHAGGELRARLNRRQALDAYPILAVLTDKADLAAAIDAGQPLAPALAVATGTSVAAARRLQGIADPDGDGRWALVNVLPLVAGVDPRHLPNPQAAEPMEAQWRGLRSICLAWRTMATPSVHSQGVVPGELPARIAAEPPIWQRPGGGERCRGVMLDAGDAYDFIGGFGRNVLVPLALDACPLKGAGVASILQGVSATAGDDGLAPLAVALLRDRSIVEIVRLSETWHGRYGAIEAALKVGAAPEALSWPALSTPFAAPGGIEAVPLTDPEALAGEGRALRHCVGSYALSCIEGPAHIVSLRRDGRRVSTAEIHLDPDGTLRLIQHRALKNGDPPAEAAAALDAYLAAMRSGDVAVDVDGLQAAMRERRANPAGGAVARVVGYDPSEAWRRDLALSLYAFALPESERGLSHAAWAKRLGLPELVGQALRRHASAYHVGEEFRRAAEGAEAYAEFRSWLAQDAATTVPGP